MRENDERRPLDARIKAMRSEYPTPDGVVGLVPLHIGYAFERDGDDDVIGMVVDTTLGGFVVWLQLENALQLASHLVEIIGRREALRERYTERALAESPSQP